MSFSAEINDFVKGFQAGAAVGGDIQDRKMRREKDKLDQEWKEKDFEFEKDKLTYAKEKDFHDRAINEKKFALDVDEADATKKYREAVLAEQKADRATRDELKRKELALRDKYGWGRGTTYPDGADVGDDEATEYEGSDLDSLVAEGNADGGEEVEEYAQGGPVGEQVEYDQPEAVAQAIPTAPPKPKLRPEPEATPEKDPTVNRKGKGDAKVLFEDVKPIVKMVLDETKAELSAKPEAIETKPKKNQDRVNVATGEGAMSNDEIKQLDAVIDPKNEMAPHELKAKRLVTAYKHFAEKGETEKAARVAKGIIAHNKIASQTLGKLAQVALEKGDLTSASKLISDAYNEVPDGKSIEAQPTQKGTILYKVNYDNRALMQGELAPQQLWQLAGGVANGTEFIKRMGEIAATAPADTSEGKPKKGKNFVYYDDAVSNAAQARKQFNSLVKQYNDFDSSQYDSDEEAAVAKKALEARVRDAKKASEKAYGIATKVVKKTGRPMDRFTRDLKAAMDTSESALPFDEAEPTAPVETPKDESGWWGKTMPTWLGGDEAAATAPAAEAVPTQPTPAAAPAQAAPAPAPATPPSNQPETKVINGKTYTKINGKWFEQR